MYTFDDTARLACSQGKGSFRMKTRGCSADIDRVLYCSPSLTGLGQDLQICNALGDAFLFLKDTNKN